MASLFADGLKIQQSLREDGALLLECSIPLPTELDDILDRLRYWAYTSPNKTLLSVPTDNGRETLSYEKALNRARQIHRNLKFAHGLVPGDRIASLLPAGIEALLIRLACLVGGYIHIALPPHPFKKTQADGTVSPIALALIKTAKPKLLITPNNHPPVSVDGIAVCNENVTQADLAQSIIDDHPAKPDDWSAIFFTSGSTGASKGVPISRGMIASNQTAIALMWPFIRNSPVMVDWLPWHHVFGGLDNLFKIIWNGGTLHIDTLPSDKTMLSSLQLMADVQPTLHIGVPLGLRLMLDAFDQMPELAEKCVANLRAIFFAGAGIDRDLWQRLCAFQQASELKGIYFSILSGYGATEAASTMTLCDRALEAPGELGIPLPGHRLALTNCDGSTEICVEGPNIAPCYLIDGVETALPRDSFGYYRSGDAGKLRTRSDNHSTLAFDGRLAEDFKLSSGVKVRSGILRASILAALAPYAQDLVISGEDRERLVALLFIDKNINKCNIKRQLMKQLKRWNTDNPGSSMSISSFALAHSEPDLDKGEISAKGQIVQSRYLRNHAKIFDDLQSGLIGQKL